jgi:hypothetical protein
LNWRRKKFGPIYKELYNFLPKKLSLGSQKYGFGIRDLVSEIRDPEKPIPDLGSRGQKGTEYRIRNTDIHILAPSMQQSKIDDFFSKILIFL